MKVETVFLRTPFNYDRDAASDDSGLMCSDPSLAQQQFREDSDINTIVKRFNLSGELPSGVSAPQYGDFTAVTDYHTALNAVIAADNAFMAMPAHVRAKFDNDAGAFVDFVSNPDNRKEAEELGLVFKKQDLGGLAEPISQEASPKGAAVDNATA